MRAWNLPKSTIFNHLSKDKYQKQKTIPIFGYKNLTCSCEIEIILAKT